MEIILSVLLFKHPNVVFSIWVQLLGICYYVRLVDYGESDISKNE